jgi:hypothetical protein
MGWDKVKPDHIVLVLEGEGGYNPKLPTKRWYDQRARNGEIKNSATVAYRSAQADLNNGGEAIFTDIVLTVAEAGRTNMPTPEDVSKRPADQIWNAQEVPYPIRPLAAEEELIFTGFMFKEPVIRLKGSGGSGASSDIINQKLDRILAWIEKQPIK